MIAHNIKIAWRNLLKYKTQNIISILSIAVGIVVTSAVHSFLENVKEPRICSEPYFDRAVKLSLLGDNPYFNPKDLEGMETLDGKVYIDNSSCRAASSSTITHNGKTIRVNQSFAYRDPDIFYLFGINLPLRERESPMSGTTRPSCRSALPNSFSEAKTQSGPLSRAAAGNTL